MHTLGRVVFDQQFTVRPAGYIHPAAQVAANDVPPVTDAPPTGPITLQSVLFFGVLAAGAWWLLKGASSPVASVPAVSSHGHRAAGRQPDSILLYKDGDQKGEFSARGGSRSQAVAQAKRLIRKAGPGHAYVIVDQDGFTITKGGYNSRNTG